MKRCKALFLRNTKLFLRDRATVFFSILSALILIALYFLFIGKQYVDGILENQAFLLFDDFESVAYFLVYLQMMAGVMVLNSVSFCTGIYGTLATDFETRKVDSLQITRLKTWELLVSYLASGFLVSYILNVLTWCITFVLIRIMTGYSVGALAFLCVLGILLIVSLIGSTTMLLVTTLVKTSAAVGVITGVLGTFLGFLCGIYMPYSQLGTFVKQVGSVLPFSHAAIWLKQIVLNDACDQLGITNVSMREGVLSNFSAQNIGFVGLDVPLELVIVLCVAVAVLCAVVAYRLLSKRTRVL
jgi:multidrug/hemolysin transport system permease protein